MLLALTCNTVPFVFYSSKLNCDREPPTLLHSAPNVQASDRRSWFRRRAHRWPRSFERMTIKLKHNRAFSVSRTFSVRKCTKDPDLDPGQNGSDNRSCGSCYMPVLHLKPRPIAITRRPSSLESMFRFVSHQPKYSFLIQTNRTHTDHHNHFITDEMVKRVLVGYGIDVDAVSGWYAARCLPQ